MKRLSRPSAILLIYPSLTDYPMNKQKIWKTRFPRLVLPVLPERALIPSKKITLYFLLGLIIFIFLVNHSFLLAQNTETIKISGTQWGVSTRYIGAVEGSIDFNINDLKNLGINTYRIYGGMSRWEAKDDDEVYGLPTVAQIKANPNVINWNWWDNIMTNPPQGSDYWWSGAPGTVWQGNARTIFSTLKQAGIRPVLTIRNVDNTWNPSWSLQLNPPRTDEDWNEWWEHVFATVYWLNVRNDYQVDDFEIHNEPDNRAQGWGGTQADYFELVKVAKNAIDYVYKTYLPGRTYHIHAPATVGDSHWPREAMQQIPSYFDTINIHDYAQDISDYTEQIRLSRGDRAMPIWLGEWGSYQNEYESISFAINLINNLIRASQPGYIEGSHLFSLYDWVNQGKHQGLIGPKGERRVSYYALRMGIRALQGGRPTFLTSTSDADLMAMTTKNESGKYLLVTNSGSKSYTVDVTSELIEKGTGVVWEFSAEVMDEQVNNLVFDHGHAIVTIPANAAILIHF